MIRISEASSIAVHALACLAQANEQDYLSAAKLAERLGCSPSHLAKVLNLMAARGLLDSSRGARGGFRLRAAQRTVSLGTVLEMIDGPARESSCLLMQPICNQRLCIFRSIFADIEDTIRVRLAATKITDLRV